MNANGLRINIVNLNNVENINKWLRQVGNSYVGRATVAKVFHTDWGNPFKIRYYDSRQKVLKLYEEHIHGNRNLVRRVGEMKGKILGCWCSPSPCHAEVLHRLAGNHPTYKTNMKMVHYGNGDKSAVYWQCSNVKSLCPKVGDKEQSDPPQSINPQPVHPQLAHPQPVHTQPVQPPTIQSPTFPPSDCPAFAETS